MDTSILVSKIALSKEGEKIGRIIRIDERIGLNNKKEVFYIIRYWKNRRLKHTIQLSFKLYKTLKITDENVSINIGKKEFEILIRKLEAEQKMKVKTSKFGKVTEDAEAAARTLTGRW